MNRRPIRSGRHLARILAAAAAVALIVSGGARLAGQATRTGWTVVAWNNLGMHCMDADFSVFAILPPYNTIQAQVIDASGHLVTSDSGVRVTYQGVADPTGSINTTSGNTVLGPKTNFWTYVLPLFGVSIPVNVGLTNANGTNSMPGAKNPPQPMTFDAALDWFIAEGIPVTPYDDAGKKNYYPLMKVTATDATGATLASTNIVLPVSDEMDCSACHRSGSPQPSPGSGFPSAQPAAGWVYDANAQRDFRLNILRLHDQKHGTSFFAGATANPPVPVLCASCHKSEALVGSGKAGVPPLTAAIHSLHSGVMDPVTGLTLDSTANRSACYRCHPGSETRCLRGTMGNAVAANGTMAIQCQNCHGPMSAVGASARTGWLQEPACQSCHTGTATANAGAIRFTSVFDASGQTRVTTNTTFATNPDTPLPGYSLYRFSSGHGGLQCSACHGSTHAEYPSSHPNDNLQSVALQGHIGTIAECSTCHTAGVPTTPNGGPHGMHPVGAAWVSGHHDAINGNLAQCQACHGTDYRGTVLSRAFAARTFTTEMGTRSVFRGAQVGCYMCHNGPSQSSANPNRAPVASNLSASTTSPASVAIPLVATDPDGNALAYRIVSQPANGTVGLSGSTATYFPYAGASGTDTFTYAAWDGSIDSNLATVTVSVAAAPCTLTATASVPSTATAGTNVTFTASATTGSNCAGTVAYDWNFGDGTPHSSYPNSTHTYAAAGTYSWTLTASLGGVVSIRTGTITVSATSSCTVAATATVPGSGTAGAPVSFSSTVTASGCSGSIAYDWDFGDGSPHATTRNATHTYASAATYTWRFQASAGGVASTRSGNITVSATQSSAPTITGAVQLSDPFRVQINGTNFQVGVKVYIGTDATAWPSVTRVSPSQLVLGGSGLRNQFPRNQAVTVKVVNPDGQYATTTFTRR